MILSKNECGKSLKSYWFEKLLSGPSWASCQFARLQFSAHHRLPVVLVTETRKTSVALKTCSKVIKIGLRYHLVLLLADYKISCSNKCLTHKVCCA